MATRIKILADGFTEDLTKLLSNFASRNTVEFSDFAEVWREHDFACVLKGRGDVNELTQFINEMYVITSKFLFVESFHMNVGAVFTLYSLFGLQPEDSRIPIRIEKRHFDAFTHIKQEAIAKKYMSLHYVIQNLKDNAFMYVVNQTLKGPLTRDEAQKLETQDNLVHLMNTYQDNFLDYQKRQKISVLKQLKERYMAEKKKLVRLNFLPEDNEGDKIWDDVLTNMEKVRDPAAHMKNTIGSRRAKLRAKAFKSGLKDDSGMVPDDLEEDTAPDKNYKKGSSVSRRPKRIPKEERRVGRPSKAKKLPQPTKKQSDNEVDISHLLEEQMNLYYPIMNSDLKNLRSKRNPYYEDSPVDKQVRPKLTSHRSKTRAEPEATVTSNIEDDLDAPDMPNLD